MLPCCFMHVSVSFCECVVTCVCLPVLMFMMLLQVLCLGRCLCQCFPRVPVTVIEFQHPSLFWCENHMFVLFSLSRCAFVASLSVCDGVCCSLPLHLCAHVHTNGKGRQHTCTRTWRERNEYTRTYTWRGRVARALFWLYTHAYKMFCWQPVLGARWVRIELTTQEILAVQVLVPGSSGVKR